MTSAARRTILQHDGRPYTVDMSPGLQPGTVVIRFAGRGVVGSVRAWRGHTWAKSVRWFAVVNRTGELGKATASVENRTSRRAAVAWLIEQTGAA